MLKYRLIFGILFSALFVGLIYGDAALSSRGIAPAGTCVAATVVILVPMALREMQKMLAKGGVIISMRIATVACLLCALWPWLEQVAEQTVDVRRTMAAISVAPYKQMEAPASSPLVALAEKIRTVKPHYLVPSVLAAAMLAALVFHSRNQKVHGAMASAGGTLLAIVYLGVLMGFFLPICMTHTSWMLLAIIGIVKSADIGAYTIGHLIGRHKLIPWLSPGKTIEGFFGGLLFSGTTGVLISPLFEHLLWPQGLILGLVLGAVGQVGDLLESLLKRDAGVKDSGSVPGFGGVLDLLDSPLLAAPAAYWLLKLLVKP